MKLIPNNGNCIYRITNTIVKHSALIASLLKDNFENFSPYSKSLSKTELEWYIKLNTKERIRKKIENKKYDMHKVMLDIDWKIIWYRASKIENIMYNNKDVKVLAWKRLHIAKNYADMWLYQIWLDETNKFVEKYNISNPTKKIQYITWVPSNKFIENLYITNWFKQISTHWTKSLKNVWIQKKVPLMIKTV